MIKTAVVLSLLVSPALAAPPEAPHMPAWMLVIRSTAPVQGAIFYQGHKLTNFCEDVGSCQDFVDAMNAAHDARTRANTLIDLTTVPKDRTLPKHTK